MSENIKTFLSYYKKTQGDESYLLEEISNGYISMIGLAKEIEQLKDAIMILQEEIRELRNDKKTS